jgi:pimeloyl-ACP methyl ester carboxylesterase
MGSLESVRLLRGPAASRIAKIALVSPITPILRKTDDNPNGTDSAMIDAMVAMQRADRDGFVRAGAPGFFGADMTPADLEWALTEWRKSDPEAAIACQIMFSSIDLRAETAAVNVPTLIIHGDCDVSSSLESTARATAALIPHGDLKVYENGPHGLFRSHADRLSADLIAFAQ